MNLQLQTREQVIKSLQDLYAEGYRYVVREKDMQWLLCFSLKPKKYREFEGWGYVDPDVTGVITAYPIKNTDITEINWTNRSATLIEDFLSKVASA